ncbi:unnamed protein product [Prorocentrum cordatum]|uniref:Uncharacterized protein n=1 Tax=Prorocentrum cordatum TaxID=2364126 RepID=A0ABN9XVW7_9DINO|nr:unnamed protein product [Polarella glacialis]
MQAAWLQPLWRKQFLFGGNRSASPPGPPSISRRDTMARRVVIAVFAALLGCGMLMSAFVPFSPMAIRPADQQPAALGTAMTPDDRIVLPRGCCILNCDSHVAIAEGQNCSSSNNESLKILSYTLHDSNAHRVAGWNIQGWLKFIGSHGVGAKFVFQVGSFGAFLDEVLPLLKSMDPYQAQQWQGVIAEANRYNVDKLKEAYVEQLSAGTLRIINTAVADVCHTPTLKFVIVRTGRQCRRGAKTSGKSSRFHVAQQTM